MIGQAENVESDGTELAGITAGLLDQRWVPGEIPAGITVVQVPTTKQVPTVRRLLEVLLSSQPGVGAYLSMEQPAWDIQRFLVRDGLPAGRVLFVDYVGMLVPQLLPPSVGILLQDPFGPRRFPPYLQGGDQEPTPADLEMLDLLDPDRISFLVLDGPTRALTYCPPTVLAPLVRDLVLLRRRRPELPIVILIPSDASDSIAARLVGVSDRLGLAPLAGGVAGSPDIPPAPDGAVDPPESVDGAAPHDTLK